MTELDRSRLVRGLQVAHAGEIAAAFAYARHARRVAEPATVLEVEHEEWQHRAELVEMLFELGAAPSAVVEAAKTGLGLALQLGGWVAPVCWMHRIAAELERRGATEYRRLAALSDRCGLAYGEALRRLAATEERHARLFDELVSRGRG